MTEQQTVARLHELFEEQVRRNPDALAVLHRGRRMSYGELNGQANQLAHHLITIGAEPEVMVGLSVERSPSMLVALLAVVKSGAAFLPIDPVHPAERVRAMLQDAQASIVISGSLPSFPVPAGVRLVRLNDDAHIIRRQPTEDPGVDVRPENLAYCIFTSGSTGRPKGVAVCVGSLVNHAKHMTVSLGIQPGDRFLQFSSLSFDAALEEIFPALIGGGALVLSAPQVPPIWQFMEILANERISIVSLRSSYWHHWVDELCETEPDKPGNLRLVIIGGERILAEKLRQWHTLSWSDQVEFIADYGPTETTISCTTYAGPPEASWPTVPLGVPISNVETHLLDDELEPVPTGVIGELYISGAGLARGYINRAGMTAERFVAAPFGAPGSRMYRSGDLGYQLPDGRIQFVGRVDDQIKVRGHRVELGEIEAVLRCFPDVRDAAVVASEITPGDIRLVGYVVAKTFSEPRLREWLAERLPPVMIPAKLVAVPRLPRSVLSGKVDRTRLSNCTKLE
ncbi:amino acid adenylation domain-containing protein [Nonomuraea sp. NPDC051941]|uniref:amino acid adenylation domain-containing protein n=1 Tax=Nonomuraea sp. NPDC051941 TaxID=3364373 RepID=UPI0037C5CED0